VASTLAALDDPATVERLDSHGLLGRIERLPEQCEEARRSTAPLELPQTYRSAREMVVLGMGGSGIAGDMLRAIAAAQSERPVHVVRGYDLPRHAGGRSLVVACSQSGGTEETLSAFRRAIDAGACVAAVTAGGRLRELAGQEGAPAVVYEYNGEPRSAIGYQLMALIAIAERAGLLPGQTAAVDEAVALMRRQREAIGFDVPSERNPAKQLAERLHGRLPAVFGPAPLAPAAYRWKTQMNENGKSWALFEELAELGHNAIEGFALPREALPLLRVVFVSHPALDARLLARERLLGAELDAAGVAHERVEAAGASVLARLLTAVYLGDYTSYYLGLLNGVEPSAIPAITRLKRGLSEA
jgi:glucose/mannose-6-phosphate isomerase